MALASEPMLPEPSYTRSSRRTCPAVNGRMCCVTTTASGCSTRSATSTPRRAAKRACIARGVRHLSRLTLTIAAQRPLLLAAAPREDNVLLTVNLTNAGRARRGRPRHPAARHLAHHAHAFHLWNGVCHEMLRVRNFALSTVSVELVIRFYSDFENIVDVRAQRRMDAARRRYERVESDSVTQSCLGADEVTARDLVDCHTAPDAITGDSLRYRLQIGSRGEKTISLAVGCSAAGKPAQMSTFTRSLAAAEEQARREGRPPAQVHASDASFNSWLRRAGADVGMLLTVHAAGAYALGGIAVAGCDLRTRRDHHGLPDAVGVAGHRSQRAAASRRHAVRRQLARATAPRRARSSTRRAAAPSRQTTTASTPRRCSSCWPARISTARRISIS